MQKGYLYSDWLITSITVLQILC